MGSLQIANHPRTKIRENINYFIYFIQHGILFRDVVYLRSDYEHTKVEIVHNVEMGMTSNPNP